ncbi:methyl-accepting chemotaxis protein [Pseudomonas tolaasii]|uniref:methyl-accepting chemotaxis protein n=1 Tax=Pseudomonas tolaasii TaxID=29442 RepID=UPI001C5A2531|nr:methyl-accepting chemotaxis protein [Pseudomonas tolaasii]MBW1248765.1 methyl-accepting chemotaxis protein [Pseudomonas tolaasii]
MKDALTIRVKLGLGFGSMLLLVLLISAISILAMGDSNNRFSDYMSGIGKRKDLSLGLLLAAQQRAVSARNLVLISSPSVKADERSTVNKAHQQVGKLLRELTASVAEMSPSQEKTEVQRSLSAIQQIEVLYGPVALNIVDLALQGDKESAILKINNECEPLLKKLVSTVSDFIEFEEKTSAANALHTQREYELRRNHLVIFSMIAAIIASVLTLIILRGLQRALGAEPSILSGIAQRIASGDIRYIPETEAAKLGSVLASFGQMQSSLSTLISAVQGSSNVISGAAEELSAAAEQTRIGISQQGMEIDQVATAIHEMAATVMEVAHISESAANATVTADQQAQAGGIMAKQAVVQIEHLATEVSNTATAMRRLKQESEHIGGVLGVIKSVADQTNLLALNAAIEAARAGDVGRGFAVVADEVRNLARHTQGATLEIETVIASLHVISEETVERMEVCRDLTDKAVVQISDTDTAVTSITAMISNIHEMVRQIARAGEEQSAVAQEISWSVTRVRDISTQSAAASEQTAASSTGLAKLGSTLQQQVERFQIG